jgi:hypothetical protein
MAGSRCSHGDLTSTTCCARVDVLKRQGRPSISKEGLPHGELSIRTLALPADSNQHGDTFGDGVLGQGDLAGDIRAAAVDALTFRKPLGLDAELIRVGRRQ